MRDEQSLGSDFFCQYELIEVAIISIHQSGYDMWLGHEPGDECAGRMAEAGHEF